MLQFSSFSSWSIKKKRLFQFRLFIFLHISIDIFVWLRTVWHTHTHTPTRKPNHRWFLFSTWTVLIVAIPYASCVISSCSALVTKCKILHSHTPFIYNILVEYIYLTVRIYHRKHTQTSLQMSQIFTYNETACLSSRMWTTDISTHTSVLYMRYSWVLWPYLWMYFKCRISSSITSFDVPDKYRIHEYIPWISKIVLRHSFCHSFIEMDCIFDWNVFNRISAKD